MLPLVSPRRAGVLLKRRSNERQVKGGDMPRRPAYTGARVLCISPHQGRNPSRTRVTGRSHRHGAVRVRARQCDAWRSVDEVPGQRCVAAARPPHSLQRRGGRPTISWWVRRLANSQCCQDTQQQTHAYTQSSAVVRRSMLRLLHSSAPQCTQRGCARGAPGCRNSSARTPYRGRLASAP